MSNIRLDDFGNISNICQQLYILIGIQLDITLCNAESPCTTIYWKLVYVISKQCSKQQLEMANEGKVM